jgi:hypothetical protein
MGTLYSILQKYIPSFEMHAHQAANNKRNIEVITHSLTIKIKSYHTHIMHDVMRNFCA